MADRFPDTKKDTAELELLFNWISSVLSKFFWKSIAELCENGIAFSQN